MNNLKKQRKMAKLTKAQQSLLDYMEKTRGEIYFRRDKKDKEQCFIGRKKVNSRVFFFFYDMGYFDLESRTEGRKYEYFYMGIKAYKLQEYLDDFKMPYCVPE